MKWRVSGLLSVAAGLVVLSGCARQFTHERFQMITVGTDDREDVRQILGGPTADLQDQWVYDDSKRHYTARIHFDAAGRVSGKEWIDSKAGVWEGQNPHADPEPQGEVREHRVKTRRIDED